MEFLVVFSILLAQKWCKKNKREATRMQMKIFLNVSDMPTHWYNIVADIPNKSLTTTISKANYPITALPRMS
jgi:hypothetical protein